MQQLNDETGSANNIANKRLFRAFICPNGLTLFLREEILVRVMYERDIKIWQHILAANITTIYAQRKQQQRASAVRTECI